MISLLLAASLSGSPAFAEYATQVTHWLAQAGLLAQTRYSFEYAEVNDLPVAASRFMDPKTEAWIRPDGDRAVFGLRRSIRASKHELSDLAKHEVCHLVLGHLNTSVRLSRVFDSLAQERAAVAKMHEEVWACMEQLR